MLPNIPIEIVESVVKSLALILGYAFIGGSLKYIDQFYDYHVYEKLVTWFLTILCGLVMGLFIAIDPHSAAILLAIIIGVGVTRKLDELPFQIITLISLIIPTMFSVLGFFPNYEFSIAIIPLTILVVSAVSDEYLDNYADKNKIKVLALRPFMKIVVLILVVSGVFDAIYFFAFMSFDIGYLLVRSHSRIVGIQKSSLWKRGNLVLLEESR